VTPAVEPAPTPAPINVNNLDLGEYGNIDLSNLDLRNLGPAIGPTAPTPAPTPEPVAPPIPLEPGDGLVPMAPGDFAGVLPANPVVQEPAPAPVTGIETLAPEDYTESVASFEGIPMPDGTVLSMNELGDLSGQFDPFGFSPNVTPPQSEGIETLNANVPEATELPANTVDFGYGPVNVADLAEIGVPGFGFDSETGGVTFDPDQMTSAQGGGTAAAGRSYTPTFENMYTYPEDFTFGGG